MIVAHVGGMPLEEALPVVLTGGAGIFLMLARVWIRLVLTRLRPAKFPFRKEKPC